MNDENQYLQKRLEEYSKPIKTIDLKQLKKSITKPFDFKPKEIKPIGNNLSSSEKVKNNVELIKIGNSEISFEIYQKDNDLIYDFIERGWFDEANNMLNNSNNMTSDDEYARFLIKNRIINISGLKKHQISQNVAPLKKLIATCTEQHANSIIDFLTETYFETNNLKEDIFNIIYQFDFPKRSDILKDFKETIVDKITSNSAIQSDSVTNYILSRDKTFDSEIKELIDISIENGKFEIANNLNSIILESDNTNTYALLNQLLINCKCSNIESLPSYLNQLSNFKLLTKILEELNKVNGKQFMALVQNLIIYINSTIQNNKYEEWNTLYQISACVCQYDLYERQKIIFSSLEYLIKTLDKIYSKELFDATETILALIDKPEAYLEYCTTLAIKSLDIPEADTRFIDEVKRIAPNTFISEKLSFYQFYGISFNTIKPLKTNIEHTQTFEHLVTELLKLANNKERKELLDDLIFSLALGVSESKDITNNVATFETLIKFYAKKQSLSLFTQMLIYSDELIKNRFFKEAKEIIKQALSLNIKEYECCFRLLLCDYEASNVDELIKSKEAIIDNDLYKLTINFAKIQDKAKYEEYLDIYSKQKDAITKRNNEEQKKAEEEAKRLETEGKIFKSKLKTISWGIIFLSLAVFILGLGVIFGSHDTGYLVAGIMFGGLILVLSISIFSIAKNTKEPQYVSTKTLVISLVLAILAVSACVLGLTFLSIYH